MSSMSTKANKLKSFLFTVFCYILVFTIFVPVIPVGGAWLHDRYFKVDCTELSVPFQKTSVTDPDKYSTDSGITQEGKNGSTRNCTKNSGKMLVSSLVLSNPVTEIYTTGTKAPEPYTGSYQSLFGNNLNYYEEGSGAICNDGSYSNATGRGACSWHGGVSEWLY